MMDGESVQQEALTASPDDASGSLLEPEEEAEPRDPLKIHIRLSELEAFHLRQPRWFCFQCRLVFRSQRRLDRHLRRHVSEARLGVRLVRLPLPADVVEAAARRQREAAIVERALRQAADDIRHGKAVEPVKKPFPSRLTEQEPFVDPFISRIADVIEEERLKEPFAEPFTLRLNEEDDPSEPFTLRLNESDDGIPEVQAEINSKDEEESLSEPEASATRHSLLSSLLNGASACANAGEKNDLYDRETILGPDLSRTLFEISKSVIRELDAIDRQHDPLTSLPVSVSSEILAVEKVCHKVVEELSARLPLPKLITDAANTITTNNNNNSTNTTSPSTSPTNNREWNKSIIDPKSSSSVNNCIPAKQSPPENRAKKTLPVPKLIPDPIYTVTKASATGVNISISSSADTIDPKTSIPKINNNNNNNSPPPILSAKNALTEPVKTPPAPLPSPVKPVPVVPLRAPVSSARMEPERCQSVMILDNESRVSNIINNIINSKMNNTSTSNNNNNNRGGAVRPAPTLMNHLLAPPSPVATPNATASRPSAPRPLPPPPIQRAHWKFNNNNGAHPASKAYAGSGELKIQAVVSLAEKHLTDDFESTCACAVCKEVRCGDLWRKCEVAGGPNGGRGPVAYRCAICCERFEGKSQLLRHCRRTKHCYICELCGSGFLVHALYNMHKKVHEAKHAASKMAAGISNGGGVVRAPPPHQPHQRRTNEEEVTVVGERILVKSGSAQRTTSTNGSADPAQLNRILHNSEITLTPIAGSNAGAHVTTGSGVNGASASLRKILPAPSSVAPPTYPLPMVTTPISTSAMSSLQELRKAVSSMAVQQQMMAAGARPTMNGNVYRMMPMTQSGPPRSAPTWHHPVSAPARPPHLNRFPLPNNVNQAPRQPPPAHLTRPALPYTGSRQPLPANATALSTALRQQMTAVSTSQLYRHLLPPTVADPRLRPPGPPNVSLAPVTNGSPSQRASPTEAPRAPPAVAPVRCHVCSATFRSVVYFQQHFDQVHKKARAPPPQQHKCGRCLRAYPSPSQLQRHEARCGDKVRCRKCNALLLRSQVIDHFALVHREPGSDPRLAQRKQQPEVTSSSSPTLPEIIEVRAVSESPLLAIRPSVTVTPIPTPPAPEATPTDTGDFSAPEVDLRPRAEESMNVVPRMEEISINVISVAQPEIVDISAESSIPNASTARPEVNGYAIAPEMSMERSVNIEPEKDVEAVAEPEVYTDFDVEAEIRKKMNFGLEEVASIAEASPSPQPEIVIVAQEVVPPPSDAVNSVLNKAASPAVSIPEELTVATPEAETLSSEEVTEVEVVRTPEIDLSISEKEAAEERACVVCDRTFLDAVSLERHLRTHTPVRPEAAHHACSFCRQTFPELRFFSHHLRTHLTSCSSSKTSPPLKRTLKAPQTLLAKRPRSDEPDVSAPAEAIDESADLAVAILDLNKLGASAEVFRRLGVVGLVSLKQLKSFLLSDDPTGTPSFIKKF